MIIITAVAGATNVVDEAAAPIADGDGGAVGIVAHIRLLFSVRARAHFLTLRTIDDMRFRRGQPRFR
jgi:hypothetical protein